MPSLEDQLTEIASGAGTLSRTLERVRIERARGLARAGKYAEANAELGGYERFSDPETRIEALLLFAKICAQQGAYDNASEHWRRALKLDPACAEAAAGVAALSRLRATPPMLFAVRNVFLGFGAASVIAVMIWLAGSQFTVLQDRIESTQATATSGILLRLDETDRRILSLEVELNRKLEEGFDGLGTRTDELNRNAKQLATAIAAAHRDVNQLQASPADSKLLLEKLGTLENSLAKLTTDINQLRAQVGGLRNQN
jgi:tetratricopeptide (TPR) repeat protein